MRLKELSLGSDPIFRLSAEIQRQDLNIHDGDLFLYALIRIRLRCFEASRRRESFVTIDPAIHSSISAPGRLIPAIMQARERKRHRLASLFGVKPKATRSKIDTADSIAGADPLISTSEDPDYITKGRLRPFIPTQITGSDEDDHQEGFDAHVSPKDGGHEVVLAPAVEDINKPVDLWRRAYQDLENREKALVETFERNITYIANATADAEENRFDYGTIQKIAEQKIDTRKAERLSIQLGNHTMEFRAVGEKIIEGLLWSSTFISAAMSTQPYAALAWSGVSMILPLLLNNSKQDTIMIEGLEKITDLMQLFHIREEIYLRDVRRPPWPEFELAVVKLYRTVFEYDARVINHLSDPTVKRGLSGTFLPSRWDATMKRIQDAKQQCEEFANLFDKSREAEQFGSIQETLASLKAFRGEHQRYRQDDQEARLLQVLSSDYKGDKKNISDRSDGTCEWFLHNQAFLDWRDSNMTSLLWVSGCPGSGKTVLSKALIDDMTITNNILSSTVCYFFFKASQERRERAADALSAILHQLFQNTNLVPYGFASYKNHGANLSQMFTDLWEILMKCAQDSEAGRITCVIDALDECEEGSRNHFIRELACLCSPKGTNQRVGCSLKFIVTSQPCDDIKDQFERLSGKGSYLHIDIDSYSSDLGRDIDLVIDRQVKEFARNLDSDKQKFIADHLKSRDKRTYLWLVLTTDIIKKSRIEYCKFPNVKKLLLGLPDKFSDQYNRILSRSKDPELAKKLLKIVAAATRPLTLMEANIALTIAMGHQQGMAYEDLELWSSDDFPSILKDLCGLIVAIHEDKLSLFHSTVRTFVFAKATADSPIATQQLSIKGSIRDDPAQRDWEGCLDISNAHGLMCQICLDYLTLSNFAITFEGFHHNDYFDSDDEFDCYESNYVQSLEVVDCNGETRSLKAFIKTSLNKYAFLGYCAVNWACHYRQQDQQHRSILQVDAELLCTPKSGLFFNWASISFSQGEANLLSGCDELGIVSYLGLADLVERFSLSADHIDAYQQIYPHTALKIAIKRGFPDVVRVLLSQGADPSLQDEYGESPLGEALIQAWFTSLSDTVTILQVLFDGGLDINTNYADTIEHGGGPALHIAAYGAFADIVDFLIKRGADVNAFGGRYGTALIAACSPERMSWDYFERFNTVRILVENGADIHAEGISGRNALQIASYNGQAEIVALLLSNGADVHSRGGEYGSALIAACCNVENGIPASRTMEVLIANGANTNHLGEHHGSALYQAASRGHYRAVRLLIEAKADINSGSTNGADLKCFGEHHGSALYQAASHGHCDVVRLLIEAKAYANTWGTNGADINHLGEHRGSALYQAASHGHYHVVRLLIEAKVDVNTWGKPAEALLIATGRGQENDMETAKFLLGKMTDANASTIFAEKMTSVSGTKEMVDFLMENRAILEASESGINALHVAAMYGRADIADTLIALGVDVNSHDFLLGTPLHCACSEKANKVIATDSYEPETVAESSTDTSLENDMRWLDAQANEIVGGFFHAGLRKKRAVKRLAMVRFLAGKKADVNARRAEGISVLHDALERDDRDLVDFLIANGASLD